MKSIFAPDKQDLLNEKHATDPQPGDYWHEMLCPVWVVVFVDEDVVGVIQDKVDRPPNHWTWDLDKIKSVTRDAFKKRMQYKHGCVAGRYWCRVEPRSHMWVTEER